jgi:hypothetical protein
MGKKFNYEHNLFTKKNQRSLMKQIFTIVPAANGPYWVLGGVSLLLVALVILMAYVAHSSRNTRFEITATGLKIKGNLYGRTIPLQSLRTDQARILNLNQEDQFRFGRRSNGVNVPGFRTGWFRLKTRERALVFVTDQNRVVYLPTTRDYVLMLSVREPEIFLETLHRTAQTR